MAVWYFLGLILPYFISLDPPMDELLGGFCILLINQACSRCSFFGSTIGPTPIIETAKLKGMCIYNFDS